MIAGTWFGRDPAAARLRLPRLSHGPDRLLCAVVLCLTALGVVMVFSAGAAFAAKKYGDWTFFLKREVIYAAVGLGAFVLGARTDYTLWRRITYPLLLSTIGMLGTLLVVGTRVGGAVRWFRLGPLSFQPSELAKFTLALYLAVLLARKAEKVKEFSVGFVPPLVVAGIIMGLVVVQPDLGTAIILGVMTMALLFVGGARTDFIMIVVLATAPIAWRFFIAGTPFRLRRMMAFLNPCEVRRGAGYQACESLISIGSGGVTGVGLGQGRQKMFFLPEAHTDFIVSILGEELGLIGMWAVLAGFGVLVWRGYLAASRARDVFGSYLAFAISTLFGLQALMNVAVALGALPTKGLPLPFISYGGTSLVISLFMAGVLANISARYPELGTRSFFEAVRGKARVSRNRRAETHPRVSVVRVVRAKVSADAAPCDS